MSEILLGREQFRTGFCPKPRGKLFRFLDCPLFQSEVEIRRQVLNSSLLGSQKCERRKISGSARESVILHDGREQVVEQDHVWNNGDWLRSW